MVGTLTGTTTPSRPESNGNEMVLYIPQSSRRGAPPSDTVSSHIQDTHWWRDFTLLQRCSRRILQRKPAGLNNSTEDRKYNFIKYSYVYTIISG